MELCTINGCCNIDVFEYLYADKELDRKSIERLKRYLHDKYAERQKEQLREREEQDQEVQP